MKKLVLVLIVVLSSLNINAQKLKLETFDKKTYESIPYKNDFTKRGVWMPVVKTNIFGITNHFNIKIKWKKINSLSYYGDNLDVISKLEKYGPGVYKDVEYTEYIIVDPISELTMAKLKAEIDIINKRREIGNNAILIGAGLGALAFILTKEGDNSYIAIPLSIIGSLTFLAGIIIK